MQKTAMTEWYNYSLKAEWTTHKIKENLKNASILKNNRVLCLTFVVINIELLQE